MLLAANKWFRSLIFVMIIFNCGLLAVDSPPRVGQERVILDLVQLPIYTSFIVEMVVLLIGEGFHSYWSDPWNRMDFFIVMGSIIDLVTYYTMEQNSENFSVVIFLTGPPPN